MNNKLNGKSNNDHNHDSRYYTETEVNNLMLNRANAPRMVTPSGVNRVDNGGLFALYSEEYTFTIPPGGTANVLFPGAPELQYKDKQQIPRKQMPLILMMTDILPRVR